VSPDGNWVVFGAQDSNGVAHVCKVQISGGTVTTMYPGDDPAIDPTGKFITFDQFNADFSSQYIWKSAFDGSGVTQLTSGATYDSFPQFSKQSDRIAFQREIDSSTQLIDVYTIKADGTSPTQITTSTDTPSTALQNTTPSWSPDGTTLCFYAQSVQNNVNTVVGLYTASSTPSAPVAAPPLLKTLTLPQGSTYWTGTTGRGTGSAGVFNFRRLHKIKKKGH